MRNLLPILAVLASNDQISDNARTRELLTNARSATKEIVELSGLQLGGDQLEDAGGSVERNAIAGG